jgi:integrase
VLAIYARDIAPGHARPNDTAARIATLNNYFGFKTLAAINGATCRAYAATRPHGSGRRELEDLRAAINHHRREGLCSEIVEVVLPKRSPGRERWLTRGEAASLLHSAWRYREKQNGNLGRRASRKHIARFILVALYTGSRAGVICSAALGPAEGRSWIDLSRGVFYRRASGKRETKKRAPPIPLPAALLGHMRRWKRNGAQYAVEWYGAPVTSLRKAFSETVKDASLGPGVTPHTLRHTAATWLMQAGVDLWEVAGYLGMTVEMLSSRYGHHHPSHLEAARQAFGKHRKAATTPVATPVAKLG